jgi:RNA polymerase sigma-70 factor, ECF subfamily
MDGDLRLRSDEAQRSRFARLMSKHRGALHAVALRFCYRDRPAADDLVQEASERAWHKFGTLHDESKALAWLVTILRNCWIDACRKRRNDVPVAEVPDQPVPSDEPSPWQRVTVESFRHAIEQLLEPYRSVVIMHDLDHLSNTDIARRLNIPYATVATRLHRGHQQLKTLLRVTLDGVEDE